MRLAYSQIGDSCADSGWHGEQIAASKSTPASTSICIQSAIRFQIRAARLGPRRRIQQRPLQYTTVGRNPAQQFTSTSSPVGSCTTPNQNKRSPFVFWEMEWNEPWFCQFALKWSGRNEFFCGSDTIPRVSTQPTRVVMWVMCCAFCAWSEPEECNLQTPHQLPASVKW